MKLSKDHYIEGQVIKEGTEVEVIREDKKVIKESIDMKSMVNGYLECALWSSNDLDTDEPMDANYEIYDFSRNAVREAEKDCADFVKKAGNLIDIYLNEYDEDYLGYDFWLSRNGHGAGFFDRGLGDVGDQLQDIARDFGEKYLYGDGSEVIFESNFDKKIKIKEKSEIDAYFQKKNKPIKESLKADQKTIDAIIRAFETDLEAEDVELCRYEETPYGYGLCFEASYANNGESEWMVFADYDDAEVEATEIVKNDLEDEPSIFNQDWLQNFTYISDTDIRLLAGEESEAYADDMDDYEFVEWANVEDDYESAEELGDTRQMQKIVDEAREAYIEDRYGYIKDQLDRDPMGYFVDDMGYREKDYFEMNFVQIDYDEAAESAIDTDGVAHFLDRYDGEEEEIEDPITRKSFVVYGTN